MSSEALDFPVVTACPLYCYELKTCNTTVGVASLNEQFDALLIPDKYGNLCVFNMLQFSVFECFYPYFFHFLRSSYNINSTNLNQIVDTKVIPGLSGTPHSCVRVTPLGPVQPGLSNQVRKVISLNMASNICYICDSCDERSYFILMKDWPWK